MTFCITDNSDVTRLGKGCRPSVQNRLREICFLLIPSGLGTSRVMTATQLKCPSQIPNTNRCSPVAWPA